MIKITDKEAAFLVNLVSDQFMDGNIAGTTWTSSVAVSFSQRALLGCLIRKGVMHSNGESCGMTEIGLELFKSDARCNPQPEAKASSAQIEAYGTKGMKNTRWRKVFKSTDAMVAWVEKYDATVIGTRTLD